MKILSIIILSLSISLRLFAQVDNIGHLSNPLWYVGWNSLSIDALNIKHEAPLSINFFTNNSQRLTIFDDPTAPFNRGYVGIGTAIPTRRLNVVDDIDLTPGTFPNSGYRWNDQIILKTDQVGNNIFVGLGAGNTNTSTSNTYVGVNAGNLNNSMGGGNTFIGWNANGTGNSDESVYVGSRAGEINTSNLNCFVGNTAGSMATGGSNTFLGSSSGRANSGELNTFLGAFSGVVNSGSLNTFVGYNSGNLNTSGRNNLFIGGNSGFSNTTGSNLTFMGFEAGRNNVGDNNTFGGSLSGQTNTTGVNNSFYGFQSGFSNNKGNDNVFNGDNAGYSNRDGSRNTYVGSQSGNSVINATNTTLVGAGTSATNNLNNATALGSNVAVMQSDNLLLGDNQSKIGIGLSGIAIGPQTSLEINTVTPIAVGNSGLRFRTLTSASPSVISGVTKVLTVNIAGDVVLGDIPGTGGSVFACAAGLTNANYITKISANNEICRTEGLYELSAFPYTIGMGVGTVVNTGPYNNFKLDLKGDIFLRHDIANGIGGDIWMLDHFSIRRKVFAMYGQNGFGVIALGPDAGSASQFTSTTANNSIYIGYNTGSLTDNTSNNTFIGYSTGNAFTGTSSEGYNTMFGSGIGSGFTQGSRNTFIGNNSGNLTSGENNVMLGQTTYISNTNAGVSMTGSRNIIIGAGAHLLGPSGITDVSNSISFGSGNRVIASNFIGMGAQVPLSIPEQQIGLGYSAPPVPGIMGGSLAKLYVRNYAGGSTAAFFNGDIYTSTVLYPSDSMLKDNIIPFTGGSAIIDQLDVKTYEFKQSAFPGLHLPSGTQIGLMAENIEISAPQLVSALSSPAIYDSSGNILYPQADFKAVNYIGFIPIMISALQQQQQAIDSLSQIVTNCCLSPFNINNGLGNRSSIQLTDKDIVILNQNTPNPFREVTEISYNVPNTVRNAMILFYDQTGKVLQKYEISHRGYGSLTIYGEDLSGGVYSYTLIIDGESHYTKRMIKE
jgi:hypothetical protein